MKKEKPTVFLMLIIRCSEQMLFFLVRLVESEKTLQV